MTTTTKLQVMKRRRRAMEAAAKERAADAEATYLWQEHRDQIASEREEQGQTTRDWLLETRDAARHYKPAVSDETVPPRRVLSGLPLRLWRAIARMRGTA